MSPKMAPMFSSVLLLLCLPAALLATSEPNAFDPVIHSAISHKDKPAFHGEITEGESLVKLKPSLAASDDDTMGGAKFICSYIIMTNKRHPRTSPVPFTIEVTNRTTGAATIKVRDGVTLSYSRKQSYMFGIQAQDCGGPARRSTKAYVMIKVLPQEEAAELVEATTFESNTQAAMASTSDVPSLEDKFAPKFDKESYFATVEEGKMYDSIVQIHASDQDESDAFNTICKYELMTEDAPFEVTNDGNIRNTEPLDYNTHRNFILQVAAFDCGGRQSDPVFVNLAVGEKCHSGWGGLRGTVRYRAGAGQVKVAEGSALHLCNEDCDPNQVNVKVTLVTNHIGKGCDRDTYAVNSQRKLCGASASSVDLLPSSSAEWAHNVPTDDGHQADQVFHFDGETTALEVPDSVFSHVLHQHFTVSAWLRHGLVARAPGKPPKEHILCMSDGDGMSRHHYGLYIHGDKLVLLLRKEVEDVTNPEDMEKFRPAEFRWNVPQVTDNQWHHYAISVDQRLEETNGESIKLYIDGKLVANSDDIFEIIDDWPLHKTKKVHNTKLTVGACWQGHQQKYSHFFKGYIAGLFLLKGATESEKVIRCLNSCKENLDFHGVSDMSSGTSVSFNQDLTEFTITSGKLDEVNRLMGQLAYVNQRKFPTPGYRALKIETSLSCEGQTVILPQLEKQILVEEQQTPVFVISGYSNLTRMVYEFEKGLRIFHDIHITAHSPNVEEQEDKDSSNKLDMMGKKLTATLLGNKPAPKPVDEDFLIDECHVLAEPPLNLFMEHLSLPTQLMEQHGLHWMETNTGVKINNADTIANYEAVIRGIHYYHTKPEQLANRTLTLYCSSQNQRFTSTKFVERLVAVHRAPPAPQPAPARLQSDSLAVQKPRGFGLGDNPAAAANTNVGMVAIIVVCVGFLLFMMVLGVVRIRAAHNRTQVVRVPGQDELEWDDSGLNITVNPMEQEGLMLMGETTEMFEYEDGAQRPFPEDSDSEEDETSLQGDYGDSTEEDEPPAPGPGVTAPPAPGPRVNELEWDHTSI